MADYTYTDGDGLEKLDPTTPVGSIEPLSVLDNAIRQIKAFLRDPISGILALTKEASTPIGTVVDFAGPNPPDSWLFCDGTALSRTDFADLFAVIGTTWGGGDGVTTFNLPDTRDRFVRSSGQGSFEGSVDTTIGQTSGAVNIKLLPEQLADHTHMFGAFHTNNNDDFVLTYDDLGLFPTRPSAFGRGASGESNKWQVYDIKTMGGSLLITTKQYPLTPAADQAPVSIEPRAITFHKIIKVV